MKFLLGVATALSLLARDASAHYIFQQISVGGTPYGVWEGVREHTNYNSPVTGELARPSGVHWILTCPLSDLSSPDLICNKGATSGAGTEVIPAKVGDEVVFTLDTVSSS